MKKDKKKAEWIFEQNTNIYWYRCSNCNYGVYDGWDCNQYRLKTCPECKAEMTNYEVEGAW